MIPAEAFIGQLRQAGFAMYAGVPCSYLTPLMNAVIAGKPSASTASSMKVRKIHQKTTAARTAAASSWVPALCSANCPWAAGCPGFGGGRVIAPFAMSPADRMDWRKIQNIESHLGKTRQPSFTVFERSMPIRFVGCRAWEHLVPGAEHCALPVDSHPQLFVIRGEFLHRISRRPHLLSRRRARHLPINCPRKKLIGARLT